MEYLFWIILALVAGTESIKCPQYCGCVTNPRKHTLTLNCKGYSLPNVTATLPANTTAYLYIALETKIELGATNFSHLPGLRKLKITTPYDSLALERTIYLHESEQDVFKPLLKLNELQINCNWRMSQPLPNLFSSLNHLTHLDLAGTRELNYSCLLQSLQEMKNNTVLKKLILRNTQTFEVLENGLSFNLSYFLEPLQHFPLTKLDLSFNGLRNIYPGLIRYAPHLREIYVTNNLLEPLVTSPFFLEVMLHPKLEIADFNHQGYGIIFVRYKPSTLFHLSDHFNTLMSSYLNPLKTFKDCLEELILKKDACLLLEPQCKDTFDLLKSKHSLFCSLVADIFTGIPCSSIPSIDRLIQKDCGGCIVFPSGGNLRRITLSFLNIYDQTKIPTQIINATKCFLPNKIQIIDISYSVRYGYRDLDIFLQSPFTGFKSLQVFRASECLLESVYFNLTGSFPNITYLDFFSNKLTLKEHHGNYFIGSPTVTYFNLPYNLITAIPAHTLSTMKALQFFNISHNFLTDVTMNFSCYPHMQTLDLSFNAISSLSSPMMQEITDHAASLPNGSFLLDISNNPLLCTCNEKKFVQWLQEKHTKRLKFKGLENYECFNQESSRVRVLDVNLKHMAFQCHSIYFFIGIGSGAGTFLALICVGISVCTYRKRWWFRYRFYLLRKMHRQHQQHINDTERQYEYDAFVSYNSRDELWINEELQPKLEGTFGLRLCLHERDFELGQPIMEQISSKIENSRKTLLILSPNFLASTYCHWEMNLAHNKLLSSGQDVLLLAILSPMSQVKMSKTLKDLLEKKTYVRWTDDVDGQNLFWDKLHQAIRSERLEPYDLEEAQIEPRRNNEGRDEPDNAPLLNDGIQL